MTKLIKLEELAMFGLGFWLFSLNPFAWWWFFVFLLAPDIGMLGYLRGRKTGAMIYNLFHHKGIALLCFFAGLYFDLAYLQATGAILFSHASMDRIFGYGLKFQRGFRFTHLGTLKSN